MSMELISLPAISVIASEVMDMYVLFIEVANSVRRLISSRSNFPMFITILVLSSGLE